MPRPEDVEVNGNAFWMSAVDADEWLDSWLSREGWEAVAACTEQHDWMSEQNSTSF